MNRRSAGSRALRRAVVALAATAILVSFGASGTEAATESGASSRVTRNGQIITSILLGSPVGPRRSGQAPSTYWLTLTDAELAYVVQLVALRPVVENQSLMDTLDRFVSVGLDTDLDVQLLIRDGRFTGDVRTVTVPTGTARSLARRMVTQLPSLQPVVSPPADAVVPVREPVFVSFPATTWATVVDRSLTAGGVTARVRARAVAFRLSSGDPAAAGVWRQCDGPGRPFDPADPASPAAQARRPGTCAVTYRTATGVSGRRDRWYGDYTVVWRAEWTTDGVTWLSLGDIPRITLFTRRVRTLSTTIESPD